VSSAQENGHPALHAPIPKEMLRLQRREYFRLKVPLAHKISCQLQAEDLARKPVQLSASVIDIGAGGVAVMLAPGAGELVIGGKLPGCRLSLPEGDPIELTLEVRNISRQTQRNGTELLRVGLRFVGRARQRGKSHPALHLQHRARAQRKRTRRPVKAAALEGVRWYGGSRG